MRIGVLCPSDIAARRFLPALALVPEFELFAIGHAAPEDWSGGGSGAQEGLVRQRTWAQELAESFGGKAVEGYGALAEHPDVDAVYIPLPPALHHKWAKCALMAGKHVMVEKPFTTCLSDTSELLNLAEQQGLAVHENYMFAFHSQIDYVKRTIASGGLGDVRVIRIDFGFPFRGGNDFRYSSALGGGALLDCAGYTLKLAPILLGEGARVIAASLCGGRDLEVDLFGSATLQDSNGLCAQVSFGMDNDYRCNLDVWGSEATLSTGRILTAPAGFEPTMTIRRNGQEQTETIAADDAFRKSIEFFAKCIADESVRVDAREGILHQAQMVEDVRALAGVR